MNQSKLAGKVACITGGGSGLGRASAIRLASEGVKVAVLGRTLSELNETVDTITQSNGHAIALQADITKEDQMSAAFEKLQNNYGRLDILFANAGINGVWAPIEELDIDEWKQTIDVNLNGTFITLKYAVPFIKQQGGSIIITSSVNGSRMFSNTGATAYSTTKAGQIAMAKMLALELAKHKIRVNVICPGAIESQIDENTDKQKYEEAQEPAEFPEGDIPLTDGRPGKAEDVADLVHFLASENSRHITGTEIWIDGAQSLLRG